MAVPFAARAAVELDEAHAALDETPREKAIAPVNRGLGMIHAVERLGALAFAAEIDGGRCLSLHGVGELVGADSRVEFGVVGAHRGVVAIERGQEVELVALAAVAEAFRVVEILDGRAFGAELDALIHAGHEAAAPIAHAVHDGAFAVFDDDKTGQIVVFAAESVVYPRAERWTATEDAAGVHLADAAGVIDAVGDAGIDHAEIIRVLADVLEPIADLQAALAVFFPRAGAGHDGRVAFAHREHGHFVAGRQFLPGDLIDERFAVKGVEMARSALHEAKDDALCAAEPVGHLGQKRAEILRRGQKRLIHERGGCHGTKAAACAAEEFTTGVRTVDAVAKHGGFQVWGE